MLLDDVDAQQVDHVLCTGDLTALAFDEELTRAARVFGPRLTQPERYTVLPGNHDRYTRDAVRRRTFERAFGGVSSATWPWVRALAPGVTLIALDVTRATAPFDSSGRVGDAQLDALARHLAALPPADAIVGGAEVPPGGVTIVALHYGLYTKHGRPDTRAHGLRDAAELRAVLAPLERRTHLVLHGHLHDAFALADYPLHVRCAGSATDLKRAAGYDVYTIDARGVAVERRVWDRAAERYVRGPDVPRVAVVRPLSAG